MPIGSSPCSSSSSHASPTRRLQVQPIPANAPQPWLPLHDLKLRYAQVPRQAKVGEAATVEIEVQADGASPAQLPQIGLAATDGVQVIGGVPKQSPNGPEGMQMAFATKCTQCHPRVHGSDLPSQGITGNGKLLTR